ncbi:hypothetical protein P154DRAFT_130744 [Amniculicola lignicola CBS 123094]|uniref:Zn(2)-C6 fungal-type domain-containing protein n=1 Tax=Amniculicola lignicola CBS 123094 TaxID=1392246 RepID=A0A6A5WLM4_9PLEO|nr:hypothetical protein P154DRAFT_130744 [Amniculicola lignicola CBS 123094]
MKNAVPNAMTATGSKRKRPQTPQKVTKRRDNRKQTDTTPAGTFLCFTVSGQDVDLHRRSAFTNERKKEVKGIRDKKACLRCRMLKRACSGDDPCKTCVAAAKAAAGSRALMWMECIRPSFGAMNIFDTGNQAPDQARIDLILEDLLDDDVALDFHIPFALNVEAASAHLASWLDNESAPSTFSVVGIFSCSSNTNLLENALDPNLGKDLRLFVHLTTYLYTTEAQGGYHSYTDDEIQYVRDSVGNRLLSKLDRLLGPSALEASADKLGKLKSLFLLILGTTVGMRYTCPDLIDGTQSQRPTGETKEEALLRLLCHYLIYIGKATSLLEAAVDEKSLVGKWKSQWNKPAAFTWNTTKGLEMQYRIEPPTDWIVSSGENESMSSIDLDLDDLDEAEEFTVNKDLEKCLGCDKFGPCAFGFCQMCASGSGSESWDEWLTTELDVMPGMSRLQPTRLVSMVCDAPGPKEPYTCVHMDRLQQPHLEGSHPPTCEPDRPNTKGLSTYGGDPAPGGDFTSDFTSFDSGIYMNESQQLTGAAELDTGTLSNQASQQQIASDYSPLMPIEELDACSFETDLPYFNDSFIDQQQGWSPEPNATSSSATEIPNTDHGDVRKQRKRKRAVVPSDPLGHEENIWSRISFTGPSTFSMDALCTEIRRYNPQSDDSCNERSQLRCSDAITGKQTERDAHIWQDFYAAIQQEQNALGIEPENAQVERLSVLAQNERVQKLERLLI